MVREPRAEPLLVVDTTWTDSNTKQHVHVPTLIDTGCNLFTTQQYAEQATLM